MCEPRRRHVQRDDKPVKLGFIAYQHFYAQSMPRRHKPPSYDAFSESSLYLAFVRFGHHLMNINAINPLRYIDFLIKVGAKIDRWESPVLYERYVRELNKAELPMEALERNLLLMQQWSMDTGEPYIDFFRKVAPAQATLWIKSGRISPWVILTAPSAEGLMHRLTPEQVAIVNDSIERDFWAAKLARHETDATIIRETLAEYGI